MTRNQRCRLRGAGIRSAGHDVSFLGGNPPAPSKCCGRVRPGFICGQTSNEKRRPAIPNTSANFLLTPGARLIYTGALERKRKKKKRRGRNFCPDKDARR